jgi:rhodanese-related sulfurtransferase
LTVTVANLRKKHVSTQQLASHTRRIDGHSVNLLAGAIGSEAVASPILQRSRAEAGAQGLAYAGNVTPNEAFELINAGLARLIDVRTPEERKFVGYVPDSVAVPWATGTAFTRNPRFLRELEGKAQKNEVLLFFCRSGARSIAAAEAATRGQFRQAFNVLEGFEGELDDSRRRGTQGGWRYRSLPWIQD